MRASAEGAECYRVQVVIIACVQFPYFWPMAAFRWFCCIMKCNYVIIHSIFCLLYVRLTICLSDVPTVNYSPLQIKSPWFSSRSPYVDQLLSLQSGQRSLSKLPPWCLRRILRCCGSLLSVMSSSLPGPYPLALALHFYGEQDNNDISRALCFFWKPFVHYVYGWHLVVKNHLSTNHITLSPTKSLITRLLVCFHKSALLLSFVIPGVRLMP